MDYLKTDLKWEDFFIQEAVELEEKMLSFNIDGISKSRIRLSLENKILEWGKYESWMIETYGCTSLKSVVGEKILRNFTLNSQQAYDTYSNYDFWNEDLLPIFIWENQLIVFGLQYNENLAQIENHVFILASPEVLTYFANILLNKETEKDELAELEEEYSEKYANIEGLNMEIKAPTLDFKTINPQNTESQNSDKTSEEKSGTAVDNENNIWEFINDRHEEYSFEAKKQFGAYIVLKIENYSTSIFKMDAALEKENLDDSLFKHNLYKESPFRRVFTTGISESLNVSQLGISLLNFKYVCITALKRSDKVVGFLVGFKDNRLSEYDEQLLENLAKESAA